MPNFTGSKIALFYEDTILVYLRDNKPGLVFANQWDIPGGGREGDETPVQCVIREVKEEFSIDLDESQIIFSKEEQSTTRLNFKSCFFVGNLTKDQVENIVFGNEGQKRTSMTPQEFLESDAVPKIKTRIKNYLEESGKI